MLVEEGKARIDARDAQGSTPLLVAVVCDQGNIALYLASKGADVEVSDLALLSVQEASYSICADVGGFLMQAMPGGKVSRTLAGEDEK